MEARVKKLLIEAENCIWVLQKNFDNSEIVEKFALKLYKIAKEVQESTEQGNDC